MQGLGFRVQSLGFSPFGGLLPRLAWPQKEPLYKSLRLRAWGSAGLGFRGCRPEMRCCNHRSHDKPFKVIEGLLSPYESSERTAKENLASSTEKAEMECANMSPGGQLDFSFRRSHGGELSKSLTRLLRSDFLNSEKETPQNSQIARSALSPQCHAANP